MDFGTLQTEVEAWIVDLPISVTARTGTFVNEAIASAAKRHNFRFMEAEITPAPISTVENQRSLVSKPADWKESRGLPFLLWQDGSTTEIDWAGSESEMNRKYAYQVAQETSTVAPDAGQPRYLLENDSDIWVYPLPDLLSKWANGNYRVKIPYWKYPADLVQTNDTNFITDNGEFYIIWKATSIAHLFNRDEVRGQVFDKLAETKWKELERADKRSQLPDRIVLAARKGAYEGPSRSGARRG